MKGFFKDDGSNGNVSKGYVDGKLSVVDSKMAEMSKLTMDGLSEITDLSWGDGYVADDGSISASEIYAYASMAVVPGEAYDITATAWFNSKIYCIKDSNGKVLDYYPGAYTDAKVTKDKMRVKIPANGVQLIVSSFTETTIPKAYKVIAQQSPLDNKELLFSGDSITEGGGWRLSPDDGKNTAWVKIIQDNNPKCITYGYGVGGTTIAKRAGHTDSILERLATMYSEHPEADAIILQGGINDIWNSVSLGTVSVGYDAILDETTFCGALESMLKTALTNWKGKKIGFITTFKVPSAMNATYDFATWMAKAKEICQKWSVPCCDLFNESALCYHIADIATVYSDAGGGLHPNKAGYMIITPIIEAWVKSLFS